MKILNSSDMFFYNMSFPPHESGKNAFKLCSNAEDAKKNCPNRWQAIQQWFKETREVKKDIINLLSKTPKKGGN